MPFLPRCGNPVALVWVQGGPLRPPLTPPNKGRPAGPPPDAFRFAHGVSDLSPAGGATQEEARTVDDSPTSEANGTHDAADSSYRSRMWKRRRGVRLMCDYHAEWPIWFDASTDGPSLDPELDLPEALVADLEAWQEHFDSHMHYENGWDTPSAATWYAQEGERLRRLLEAEIGRDFNVRLIL